MDGEYQVATNAELLDGNIQWTKPDIALHLPEVASHDAGSNFFDRDAQLFHFVLSGGHIFELDVAQTILLELGVMQELDEEAFYDNGNLAGNIAALLGIDPSRIRIMTVIREDSRRRRRRRANMNIEEYSMNHFRFRRQTEEADLDTLVIEFSPENESASGIREVNYFLCESLC